MVRLIVEDPPKRSHHKKGSRPVDKPFDTVDGEGGNIPDPDVLFGTKHVYQLLTAGEFKIRNPAGLTYEECFDFLSDLPKDRIWVAFHFDYDVTMICRGISEGRARRLFDPTERQIPNQPGRSYSTIEIDNRWEIGYLPHKEFRVRRVGEEHFTVISDTQGFFQGSFLKTIKAWKIGTPEQLEQIGAGKEKRAEFTEMTAEIESYNDMEIVLHNELMEKFRQVCIDIGYVPGKWQGAGNLASAILKAHNVVRREQIGVMNNYKFRKLANDAYYGGRAEAVAFGPIPGPIYQYDINSAYPSALRKLPCLVHGKWKHITDTPAYGTAIYVAKVEFWHVDPYINGELQTPVIYNLPVRQESDGIYFPSNGTGHYWSNELEAAYRAGTRFKFIDGWQYVKACECHPFDWIESLYIKRQQLGKSDRGNVLKLGMNSIYGKLAQSIGYAPYANPMWAGMITAECRAQIIDAYRFNPGDVLMIMTDGIFLRHTPMLPVSKNLGDWDITEHNDMFIVAPGIYFLPGDIKKTRGVPLGAVQEREQQFRDMFEAMVNPKSPFGTAKPITIPMNNFITMRQALARHKWHIAGTWEKGKRDISFDWSHKRQPGYMIRDTRNGIRRTEPYHTGRDTISHGYKLQIGGEVVISPFDRYTDPGLIVQEDAIEQPDFIQPLFSESLYNCYIQHSNTRIY